MSKNKWLNEKIYIDFLTLIKNNVAQQSLGINDENCESLPYKIVPELNEEYLDLSQVPLSHVKMINTFCFNMFLYQADLKSCYFEEVAFQGSFAKEANFAHSHFEKSQAVPFYAPSANFENCIFESFLTFGFGATNDHYADWNDFRHCNFSNAQIFKSTFEYAYFSGSYFSSAVIEETVFKIVKFGEVLLKNTIFRGCKFKSSHPDVQRSDFLITDFRGAQFENTRFENCIFDRVFFDDDPKIREMIHPLFIVTICGFCVVYVIK